MEVVRGAFRPEFLNRLDETLIFNRLSRGQMAGIVSMQLGQLQRRLEARNISLSLDEEAEKWLAREGYNPAYGARPLKRVIQRYLQNPLAEKILTAQVNDGDHIRVSVKDNSLSFETAPQQEQAA
jgi:ATP-dependent Clp protease ATP-binding subunit ClpB